MTQSIAQVPFQDIHDPGDIVQGRTMETRVYYRPATVTSFIEKSTEKELKPLTPEIAKEIRRRVALGEVEEKKEPIYIPTTPLPADAWHMNHYVKKGFRLWPPGEEPNQESQATLEARVKELEGQLNEAVKTVKTETDKPQPAQQANPLVCQVEGCPREGQPFETFIGLARHMRTKHGQK